MRCVISASSWGSGDGLLFLCYQSSLSRSFIFVQRSWANAQDFPQPSDGEDPIISQALQQREFNLPPQTAHMMMARWVFTTGGEFLSARRSPQ
ncbi:MAG: hypothetical protein M3065_18420 [Actinomycetota bacterium]|nr:hypothetical protein [Actinomycetota bacterium]